MCLRMSSDVIESSAGLSSAGTFAACAVGDGEAFADVLVGFWVVAQAHAAASRSASAKEVTKRLFIVCFASLFGTGDRKSTRLNSSHRTISYAVFCLKKKTITNS